ncbi:MAG: hypothetical protein ACTSYQ_01520 [Candidatus Odinarchaeia archaeon]
MRIHKDLFLLSVLTGVNISLIIISALDILNYYNILSSYPPTPSLTALITPWPTLAYFMMFWSLIELSTIIYLTFTKSNTGVLIFYTINSLNIAVIISAFVITAFSGALFIKLLTLKIFISLIAIGYLYYRKDWVATS